MGKFSRVIIAGVFLTGFTASVICFVCTPRMAMGCCYNKTKPVSSEGESCLSHCARQKTFAASVESQFSVGLKNQGVLFVKNPATVNLQIVPVGLEINTTYYVSQSIVKLNTGQIYFAHLFNHSPPLPL
jgi:hypothetical protein